MTKYIGIDGCKEGWFYVSLDEDQSYDFGVLNAINDLTRISNRNDIILIDIPIGLREKEKEERLCDKAVRKLLKKKGPSVFPAPSRLSLNSKDYHTASELNYKYTGRKLSKQSYSIMPKIKDVDDFIQTLDRDYKVREFHPELCFLALNNFNPLKYSKKKKEGQKERENILNKYLKSASDIINKVSKQFLRKQVAIDDITDALVGAVAATFKDQIISVPQQPEVDNKNLRMEILYPHIPKEDAQFICHECVDEEYLKEEIRGDGKKEICTYCNKMRKSVSLAWFAERLHSVITELFYLTPNEPSHLEYVALNNSDSGYIWERTGEPVDLFIQDIAGIDEIIANDVQNHLSDIYGFSAIKDGGEEDPYDSEACYEEHNLEKLSFQDSWEYFCKEIKYRARFFNLSAEQTLLELFSDLNTLETFNGKSVIQKIKKGDERFLIYRARVCQSQNDIKKVLINSTQELGAPPAELAKSGRMNPIGISVFYGATDIETCIAEVRPPVGSHVILGQFQLLRDVRLLNFNLLKKVYVKDSYFDPEYKSRKGQAAFLENIVNELTRPIMPSEEEFEYLPTQVVAEYLSEKITPPIDGIIFKSSQIQDKGQNIILFNQSCGIEPYNLPEESKISIDFGWTTEDDYDDSITVFEEISKETNQGNKEIKDAFLDSHFGGSIPEHIEIKKNTLKLDIKNIKIFHIEASKYQKHQRTLTRLRHEQSDFYNTKF